MMVALEPIDTRLPITVSRHISLRPPRRTAGRKGVVDEHHAVADEAVLADRHEFADEGCATARGCARRPTAPRWISVNGPTKQSSPMLQP